MHNPSEHGGGYTVVEILGTTLSASATADTVERRGAVRLVVGTVTVAECLAQNTKKLVCCGHS